MIMTNGDIAKEYREAKDPKKQIEILADRNKTTKSAIVDILRACGEKVPGNYGPKKPAEAAAVKEAEQPEKPVQAETPEVPVVTKDHILTALIKAEKKITALEDVLALVFGGADEYRESRLDDEADAATMFYGYIIGLKDTYEALNGPIIR